MKFPRNKYIESTNILEMDRIALYIIGKQWLEWDKEELCIDRAILHRMRDGYSIEQREWSKVQMMVSSRIKLFQENKNV